MVDGHYGPNVAYELIRFAYADAPVAGDRLNEPPSALSPNPIAEPDLVRAERHRLVFEGGAMGGMAGAMMRGRMMDMRELVDRGRLWAIDGQVPDEVHREPPLLQAETGASQIIELINAQPSSIRSTCTAMYFGF